jgi:hypothetical protein
MSFEQNECRQQRDHEHLHLINLSVLMFKTFFFVTYTLFKYARAFVPVKVFEPSLIFVGVVQGHLIVHHDIQQKDIQQKDIQQNDIQQIDFKQIDIQQIDIQQIDI